MIVSLRGVLESRGADWAVVSVGGVGVQVSIPYSTLSALGPVGSEVRLHTHLQLTPESLLLYGFTTVEERSVFLAVQSVSGVGPRLALALLGALSPGQIAAAIEAEDIDTLVRAPGLGKRTASRLVVELKGKLSDLALEAAGPAPRLDPDLLEALQALGYSIAEARRGATTAVDGDRDLPLEERLRRALQALAAQ